jgi:hypothetical protein
MKIYRNNKDPRKIGLKFDDLASTQMLLAASGTLEDEVKVSISYRNRDLDGDFNADPDYIKNYDADSSWVVKTLLDACDRDCESKFKVHFVSDDGGTKVVSVRRSDTGMTFQALIDSLIG